MVFRDAGAGHTVESTVTLGREERGVTCHWPEVVRAGAVSLWCKGPLLAEGYRGSGRPEEADGCLPRPRPPHRAASEYA